MGKKKHRPTSGKRIEPICMQLPSLGNLYNYIYIYRTFCSDTYIGVPCMQACVKVYMHLSRIDSYIYCFVL